MSPIENPYRWYLCTAEQCRSLDKNTIDSFGIDSFTLMETAALQAARFVATHQGDSRRGLYICGKGNNAGDALAMARYLLQENMHDVTIYFVSGSDKLSPDADKNLGLLEKLKDSDFPVQFSDDFDQVSSEQYDYIVDGMLGTGLSSPLRSAYKEAAGLINRADSTVFSVDIPTGLHADSGEVLGDAVSADYTLTFGVKKTGFYFGEGKNRAGEIILFQLPFARQYIESRALAIDEAWLPKLPSIKRQGRHKYDNGVVHLLAGSEGLTGAAIMAAKSAWSAGASAVILYAPKGLLPVYETAIPDIIKIPAGTGDDFFYKPDHLGSIAGNINRRGGVILAGPGAGLEDDTRELLLGVLEACKQPAVLDADGLSAWKKINQNPEKYEPERMILTPHPGELKNYLDEDFNSEYSRFNRSVEFIDRSPAFLLSKGNPVVFGNSKQVYITGYDTSAFTRAGFGDVLGGTIAANLAISGNPELSIIHALLSARIKSKQKTGHLAPADLL